MKRPLRLLAIVLLFNVGTIGVFAQTSTISGNVRNSANRDVVPAVSVVVKGTSTGTFTDEKGNLLVGDHDFSYTLNRKF